MQAKKEADVCLKYISVKGNKQDQFLPDFKKNTLFLGLVWFVDNTLIFTKYNISDINQRIKFLTDFARCLRHQNSETAACFHGTAHCMCDYNTNKTQQDFQFTVRNVHRDTLRNVREQTGLWPTNNLIIFFVINKPTNKLKP